MKCRRRMGIEVQIEVFWYELRCVAGCVMVLLLQGKAVG